MKTSTQNLLIQLMRAMGFVAALAVAIPSTAADGPRNLLFFGNSFTNGVGSGTSVPILVRLIAESAGHPSPHVVNPSVSSADLDYHLNNSLGTITSGVPVGETWDAVVLQERSTKPTTSHPDGNVTQFRDDAVALYDEVAAHSPDVEAVLFETWARAPGHEFYTGANPIFPGGPAQMQNELRLWYGVAANDLQSATGGTTGIVAPVGDAFEVGNWDNLHDDDLFHAQNRGTVLAALVIYGTIYDDRTGQTDLSVIISALSMDPSDELELKCYADTVLPIPDVGPADLDSDGDVDEADLAMWNQSLDRDAGGDIDGDGDTDGDDFLIWQRDFTGAYESPCAALRLPEPAGGLSCLIGCAALLARKR